MLIYRTRDRFTPYNRRAKVASRALTKKSPRMGILRIGASRCDSMTVLAASTTPARTTQSPVDVAMAWTVKGFRFRGAQGSERLFLFCLMVLCVKVQVMASIFLL
jgi:hypothetical protein